ncbi:MAG: CBS domain-containing protein, partial [Rubrivivax sp.]|nr:CBS domain-containing protein [Rubrivivax sp.]
MKESTPFFRPVGTLARRELVTCDAQQTVTDVARLMHEHGISGVVVCDAGRPEGIVTDRDLRGKVLAQGRDPARTRAAEIMSTPLVTLAAERPLHEALHRMSRQGIHRLVLTDADGALAGIVTATDLMRLQAHSALGLVLDIEQAPSVEALAPLHAKVQALVVDLVRQGLPTAELVRTVARLNDQVLVRLIELVRAQQFPRLSDRFAFLVLGSEGRCEQT